jgi:glycosyltransferase involved in cell wall biosynthesis
VAEAPLWRKPFRVWQYRFNIGYRLSAFRKIKHQVFISEAQREIITARQDMRGISSKVIYNPVGKDFIKEPVNIHKSNDFLFVGTLQKYKGVDLLLEAFKKVSNEYPHARLKIVGQGDTLERYQAFMARSGLTYRVEFLGRVDPHKIIEIYDQVGILVAPHIWAEPFGRTVVEAMSRGKIVIAADTGGPGEIIKNGVTGLLFKTGSVNDLERSLREVLEMPDIDRREISQAARGWVQHNLNSEKISRQYEEFYSKIRL